MNKTIQIIPIIPEVLKYLNLTQNDVHGDGGLIKVHFQ